MARQKNVDDWLDTNNIEKPVKSLRQVGFTAVNSSKDGPLVGMIVKYAQTPTATQISELRVHMTTDDAKRIVAQFQSYIDLAENHMPDPTPNRPN